MSVLAQRPGRVAGEGLDAEVAAHYGDPLREQRAIARGAAVVDRSNRGLVVVTGADRLSWLHSLTSQHLEQLPAGATIEGLILSPHGHVEQDLWFTSIGEEVWIDCEPAKAAELADYLDRMRFMLRVEVEDRSDSFAMATLVGLDAASIAAGLVNAVPGAVTDAGEVVDEGETAESTTTGVAGVPGAGHVAELPDGGWLRTLPFEREYDVLGSPAQVDAAVRRILESGAVPAGTLAYDAWRVERMRPRLGLETDHRTIPHEIGLIGSAVHLNKGCYRGQETVARVHNLGRPPRRLVKLQVDGSQHTVPSAGSKVFSNNREVGFVGTSVMHHEEGPIALAVVKRNVASGAEVLVRDEDVEYAAIVDQVLDV